MTPAMPALIPSNGGHLRLIEEKLRYDIHQQYLVIQQLESILNMEKNKLDSLKREYDTIRNSAALQSNKSDSTESHQNHLTINSPDSINKKSEGQTTSGTTNNSLKFSQINNCQSFWTASRELNLRDESKGDAEIKSSVNLEQLISEEIENKKKENQNSGKRSVWT